MTTSTENDPAICKHCNRAHEGGWNPRHPFEPMSAATRETSLRGVRAYTAERTRADRLREAGEALEKCGLRICVEPLHSDCAPVVSDGLDAARHHMRGLISRLSDGSDEPRYAAAMTARRALGALWEVL